MSTQVQRRKGTTVQHSTFTGASAELTVDTTKNTVVVHDGATAGGIPLAKETGSAISATSLSLPNSTTNGVAYVNGSKVVVAGSVFTFDGNNLSVNNITVGKGPGTGSFNTAVGQLALGANVSSSTNTAIGYNAMKTITTGSGNTAVGTVSLALASNTGNNTAIGWGALFPSTGTQNTALGFNAGGDMTLGSKNVIIGSFSGNDYLYGTGLDIRTLNNYIVLSDGDANVRAYWNGANPTFPGALTLSDGTANGVPYLNGSKVLTSGTALTFDGTSGMGVGGNSTFAVSGDGTGVNGLVVQAAKAALRIWGTTGTNQFLDIGVGGGQATIGTYYSSLPNINYDAYTAHIYKINGAEQMRLTSTGLGIGTTSTSDAKVSIGGTLGTITAASRMLQIVDPAGGALFLGSSNTNYSYLIHNTASSTSQWLYRGGVGVTLDSSGNLGLGASPSAKFDVQTSSGRFQVDAFGGASVQIISSAAMGYKSALGNGHLWNIDSTQAMTLDASGNLLVGTPSSVGSSLLQVNGTTSILNGNLLALWNSGNTTAPTIGNPDNSIAFFRNSGAEAARIDASGNLLVGKTSANDDVQGVNINFNGGIEITTGNTGTQYPMAFYRAGSTSALGSITTDGSNTAYNTSSDYRLKNITGPITTSGAYIDSLNPVEGTWKADGSTFVGLIAHETQEVSRTTVATGTKDGEQMQGMDYSSAEIIANLIAELQSVRTRLAALEAK